MGQMVHNTELACDNAPQLTHARDAWMAFGQTTLFAQLSEAIAGQVAAAAPLLAAIRVGPN